MGGMQFLKFTYYLKEINQMFTFLALFLAKISRQSLIRFASVFEILVFYMLGKLKTNYFQLVNGYLKTPLCTADSKNLKI